MTRSTDEAQKFLDNLEADGLLVGQSPSEALQADQQYIERRQKLLAAARSFGTVLKSRVHGLAGGEYDITRLIEIGPPDTDIAIAGKQELLGALFAQNPQLEAQNRAYVGGGVTTFMDYLGTAAISGTKLDLVYKFTDLPLAPDEEPIERPKLEGSPFVYEGTTIRDGRRVETLRLQWHTMFGVSPTVPAPHLRTNPAELEGIDELVFNKIAELRLEY